MTKIFFRYKPVDYFIESENYDISWTPNKPNNKGWYNLEEFDYSEIGESAFFKDFNYIHTEFKYDLLTHNKDLHAGFEQDGKFGCEILENNGKIYFYEIYEDLILEKYPREEYPEYYL